MATTKEMLALESKLIDFARKGRGRSRPLGNPDREFSREWFTLTHAGLQRHRVLWIREMSDEEIRIVGETGPTIDSIHVVEFESHAELKKWVAKNAPAFVK